MNFNDLFSVAPFILGPRIEEKSAKALGYGLLIRGKHGIGKSEAVHQMAEIYDLPVVERRASQMSEGDLIGLPKLANGCTKWLPPDWVLEACEKPVFLFLDELDRAFKEVRQGFFQLADSREIAGNKLHPGTKLIAAINGGEHGKDYQVYKMGEAEKDRWVIYDFDPSAEDWFDYATGQCFEKQRKILQNAFDFMSKPKQKPNQPVLRMIVDFLIENPTYLEHLGNYDPIGVYPSRRAWKRLSDTLWLAGIDHVVDPEEEEWQNFVEPAMQLYQIAKGFVGEEPASALKNFYLNYKKTYTPEMVLSGEIMQYIEEGKVEIEDFAHLFTKFAVRNYFEEDLDKQILRNFADFYYKLDPENAVLFFIIVGKMAEKNQDNFEKFLHCGIEMEVNGKVVTAPWSYWFACLFDDEEMSEAAEGLLERINEKAASATAKNTEEEPQQQP